MKRTEASFVKSAGLISILTLLSRILGVVREAVCANYFGAGALWGDFCIAFRIPNLARRLFGEGALSAAFIPVVSERLHLENRDAAARLTGGVLLLLSAVLTGLVVLGEIGIWVWLRHSPDRSLLLTAVMLPYMVFICVVALMAGAQNVVGQFGVPSMMPILFNTIMIGGAVLGSMTAGGDSEAHVYVLCATVLLAGIVQLVVQWWALARGGFRPVLIWNPTHPDIRRIASTMAPMLIGLAAVQLNSLADLTVAKIFVEGGGGPAVLSYAERLYQLPTGMFGVAIATAIFPQLAKLANRNEKEAFTETLQRGLRLTVFVGVPASIGLLAVRYPLVKALYERGEFTAQDTLRVANVVGCYGLGVWAYIGQQVLIRGYYSVKNVKIPMHVSTATVVLNLGLNLLLVQWFAEPGIALATAFSTAVQVVALILLYPKAGLIVDWRPVLPAGIKVMLASAAMYAAVYGLEQPLKTWESTRSGAILQLAVLVTVGAVTFALCAKALGCEEMAYLRRSKSVPDAPGR